MQVMLTSKNTLHARERGPGTKYPLGVSKLGPDRYNFSLYCTNANLLTLNILNKKQTKSFPLHRSDNYWHTEIEISPPFLYSYFINEHKKHILDPYAHNIFTGNKFGKSGNPLNQPGYPYLPLAAVDNLPPFNWESVASPSIPMHKLIIYEMHVRGFTQDRKSGVNNPGTFLGIIEKIPYLKKLGINAIELMPITEFNELEYARSLIPKKTQLLNYWGYSPVSYFAPMSRYASSNTIGAAKRELQQLVKALHQNGIEIILDVVYNHTSEGGEKGPTTSFRALSKESYYLPNQDYTGCGNTLNANHPITQNLILDSLRHFVQEFHIDGFRFDLASTLARGADGQFLKAPPILNAILSDPILSNVKLIAEPWDAAGGYHVGNFPSHGGCFAEWNDQFRINIRHFIRGDPIAPRFTGSEDLYKKDRTPAHSINMITCHDGFTLSDLVTFHNKKNINNGEDNRDGSNANDSWNCGEEGLSDNSSIISLRLRQRKNFILALLLSQGVPQLLMGDEYGHTKNGNNNTWCHDSPLNWFQWEKLDSESDFFRFYQMAIQFRKDNPILSQKDFLSSSDITWLSPSYFILHGESCICAAFNTTPNSQILDILSPQKGTKWHWIANTANSFYSSPSPLKSLHITLEPYTAIILKEL